MNATVDFHRSRRHHPGVESAIGALQSGNGLERCRDATEMGLIPKRGTLLALKNSEFSR